MNAKFVIGAGLQGSSVRAWTKPQSTPDEICSAMRNCTILSHDDMTAMLACFAAMVQKPSALTDKCTSMVVDMLDEITGHIEYDKCEQQADAMWLNNKRATA